MNRYEIDALVDRGDDFYQDGDYDKAIDFYIRALEMDVKNQEALEGLGQAYAAQCNWSRAAAVFEQLVEVDKKCASSHYLLGHTLGALGEHDRALEELYLAESLGYCLGDLHSAIGYALHMKGDIENAIESYQIALDLDPDDTITMFNYGKALIAQRSFVAARHVLEHALNIDPEDAQTWIALGEVYEDLDELDLAFHAYQRALDLDPESPETKCLSAHASLMLGHYEEAEHDYMQVVEQHPDDSEAWAGLGEVLIAQERYHEAVTACRKALDGDPPSIYGLPGYINACEHTGDFNEARRAVNESIRKDRNNSDLWYLLAGIEASADKPEQALLAYQRATKLNPCDAASHAGVGWALIELQKDYALAEIHLLESVRLAPDWYYPCLQLGELFLKKQDRHSAVEWFTRAIEIAPNDPEVQETMCDPEIRGLLRDYRAQ
ncbi:MAG: tetratricopeptide repeat protein [Armatimonadota bacterium]